MPDSPVAHLNKALDSCDIPAFLLALANAVRAHGEATIANVCGWSLAELEAMLKPDSDPSFSDVQRIWLALGVRLTVQPLHT